MTSALMPAAAHDPGFITDFPPADADGITPMMAQYLDIKKANPDCLLFYRMGDFYEMFFQDAIDAALVLDITLTHRGKVDDRPIPMCGVPFHAAETYLARLIRQGFRVAICEQAEEAARGRKNKTPLRREVVRIITPGTLVEDGFLPPQANNFLAALGASGGTMALAWVDLSTSVFFSQITSAERLEEVLVRLNPAELIVAESVEVDPMLDTVAASLCHRPPSDFDSTQGEARLKALYGVATLDGMGQFSRAELSAAGAILAYLDATQKNQQYHFKPIQHMESGGVMEIDPSSRRSLEMTATLDGGRHGSLIDAVDCTRTNAGGRLLAHRLLAPITDIDAINERLDLAAKMIATPRLLDSLEVAAKSMPDLERSLARLRLNHGGPKDLDAIMRALTAATAMAQAIQHNNDDPLSHPEPLAAMAQRLKAPSALIAELRRYLSDTVPHVARDGGFIRTGVDAALDELRALRDDCRRHIAAMQTQYAEMSGIAALKVKHNNVLGYHIEVRSNHASAMMQNDIFIHRQTTAQTVRFSTTELGALEQKINSAGERAIALEVEHFARLRQQILAETEAIAEVAGDAACLDVACATATLALRWNYCRPTLRDDNAFKITQGRHAVVEQMLADDTANPFVGNDCILADDDRLWLLTGPNMAGKSTYLRQNALIAILAQAGLFVPAEAAEIGIIDRLFCRVGAADDLARGRSTFMVEMVETAAILNRAGAKAFVILDEIGRGTATYDGLSLAWAVLEHLHEVNRCRTLFATHYHELSALTRHLTAFSTHAMKVQEWQGAIVFLHEVIAGSADRSYGIHVARLAGIPPAVLARAEAVLISLVEENAPIRASAMDDLPLFTATPAPASTLAADNTILEAIGDLLPDSMTPREALEALYRLKTLYNEAKND